MSSPLCGRTLRIPLIKLDMATTPIPLSTLGNTVRRLCSSVGLPLPERHRKGVTRIRQNGNLPPNLACYEFTSCRTIWVQESVWFRPVLFRH